MYTSGLNPSTVRDAAQAYLDAGLRPIPVWPVAAGCKCGRACEGQCLGKVPVDPHWADRGPFVPADFEVGCNIALAMGRQPDGRWLLGLDYDGEPTVPWGALPETLTTRSGRGTHYVFRVPIAAPYGNWVDALGARDKTLGYRPGHAGAVDLRYARGALLAGPSIHKSGSRYATQLREPAALPYSVTRALLAARRLAGRPVAAHWARGGKRP